MPIQWQAGAIINQVAVEVGLESASNPYSSTLDEMIQLRTLLNTAGIEVARMHDWKVLTRECTGTGDGATTHFDVPADFERMVDQSGWDRTEQIPFSNPVNPEGWQAMTAQVATVATTVLYRMVGGQVVFYTAPANGNTVAFEYLSNYWVQSALGASPDKAYPTLTDDLILLDAVLVCRALKLKYQQAKSLDSSGAQAEFEAAFSAATGQEPAATLNLAVPRPTLRWNVPDTNYGVP